MTTTLTKALLTSALLVTLAGCGGPQTNETPPRTQAADSIETAMQSRWVVDLRDDGAMVVKLSPSVPETQRGIYDAARLDKVIADADALHDATDDAPDGFDDIAYQMQAPGVLALRGHVDSEREYVRLIDALLGVEGIVAVQSYVDFPGSRIALERLQAQR